MRSMKPMALRGSSTVVDADIDCSVRVLPPVCVRRQSMSSGNLEDLGGRSPDTVAGSAPRHALPMSTDFRMASLCACSEVAFEQGRIRCNDAGCPPRPHPIRDPRTLALQPRQRIHLGGPPHAYRRKWAIERKHLPLKDVAAAGGWKDVSTLLEVYQQSDEESVLAVTSVT